MVTYKSDWRLITWLFNVKEHLEKDYDFVLVIVGDTGTGKSMLALHIMELWYGVMLQEKVTSKHIDCVSSDYLEWVEHFKVMRPFDVNIYDEASTALDSKDFMTRLSRDLSKLFNVCRSKRFFSIIVLPSYWGLNKYFRENRLRGLIWVDKRGRYKLYSKKGIKYLNAYNEGSNFKRMDAARPVHEFNFPDYKGVLKDLYKSKKDSGVDRIIDDVVTNIKGSKMTNVGLLAAYGGDIKRMLKKGRTVREIAEELEIGVGSVSRIKAALRGSK